jgi:photosystem II stability/assembly factor-like uncharacterized protein
LVGLALGWGLATQASAAEEKPPTPFDHLEFRAIGPVNMSGRVADVEGIPGNPNVVYVGAASGGVWKTTNGGLTFAPIFDDQPIASIGDIGISRSNPDVIYVGSGEANARNSVSFGNGVYKTTDGGQSWTHVGLDDTRHIPRVLVSPNDPDRVYVAAMGHFSGPNAERGVFRSTDGGESWEKVLYVDDQHGASDLEMDPTNPLILYAAFWHFDRKPWTHTTGSEGGGVWKSVDGGDSWTKLTEGLPEGVVGRIAVKVAPSNPEVVYVMTESDEGTLYRSDDRGETFRKVYSDSDIISRGLYYTELRVDPVDDNRVYAVASRLFVSIDGGKSFTRISRSTHVDFHTLWIDPENPRRMWQGQDGGVAVSYDRGESWEPIRNLPIGQFYQVFYDHREPFYYLGGGLQDNGTWYGPSRTREPAGILEDDWRMMSFGDAYWVVAHPEQVDLFLSESQAGGIVRTDMTTRQQIDVSPQSRRNDGGPVGDLEYRFNWNAPIVASPHDPKTVYFGANVVFKTQDFGDSWTKISPDLTTDDPAKQGPAGGPAWVENTTAEYHCTIISLAESPVEAGLLWVGTDDGNLQVSRNGGDSWSNVIANVPGVPAHSPVSHIEPSATAAGTAYATFDRHMFDDLRPHLYRTDDFGATWRRLSTEGIPDTAWAWVLREDPKNPDLLWLGTELGLYASYDRGASWMRHHLGNLPTVSVHDILVHERDNDLILGTHGRAIWVFDDATALQQWSPEIAAKPVHLFDVRPALRFPAFFTRYGLGDKEHRAPNTIPGAILTYFLKEEIEKPKKGKGKPQAEGGDEETEGETAEGEPAASQPAAAAVEGVPAAASKAAKKAPRLTIEILDASGAVIRTLDADKLPTEQGLNRTAWDLALDPADARKPPDPARNEFGGGPRGPQALPGRYTARITLDGESQEVPVEVRMDPTVPLTASALQEQFDAARKLTAMQSALNRGLKGLDQLAAQLAERRKTVKAMEIELPEEVETRWKDYDKAAEALLDDLARPDGKPFWSTGPRLADRVGALFGDIDGGFRAPTAAQKAYLETLAGEVEEALDRIDAHLTGEVAALNTALEGAGVPPVAVPASPREPAD